MDLPIYQEHWTAGRQRTTPNVTYEYGVFKLLQEREIVVEHRDQGWGQFLNNGQVSPLKLFNAKGETVGYLVENYSFGSAIKSSVMSRGNGDRPFSVDVYDHDWNLVLYIKQQMTWDKKEAIKVYLPGKDQFGQFHPKVLGKVDISGPLAKREYNLKVFDVANEDFTTFGHIVTAPRSAKFGVTAEGSDLTIGGVDIDWVGLNRSKFTKVPIYTVRFGLEGIDGIDQIYHNIGGEMMYDMRAVLFGAGISLDHAYFSKFK